MRKVIAIILTVVILLGAIPELSTYVWFQINQSNIVKTLCEQRSNRSNTCQGKCFLKKQLKEKRDQKKQKNKPINQDENRINLFLVEIETLPTRIKQGINPDCSIMTAQSMLDRLLVHKLLRPPQF